MKNKFNLRCLILSILAVISVSSCKKDANVKKPEEKLLTNAVSIENGYLKFRDQKAFDSIGTIISNYSPKQLEAWETSFKGFTSYRSLYNNIQKEYSEVNDSKAFDLFQKKYSEVVTIRPDSSITFKLGTPYSAIFMNTLGEFKVGDQFRKYTKANSLILYTGAHRNESELKNTSDMTVVPVKRMLMTTNNTLSIAPPPGQSFNNGMLSQRLLYNGDNKRRVYIELWHEFTPPEHLVAFGSSRLYFSVLQELKKTFGGWRSNETDYYSNGTNLQFTTSANNGVPFYSFNGSFGPHQGVNGPVIYNMPSFPGPCNSVTGTARFTTGGVPDAPTVYY
ncbi:hypothetical protein DBR40_14755 [Pedobacter sp. KBW01]|uniref:hypothetical protein n=1 Tax=Pedobacter sp. KBW01 TaxID=2153364 RepID=UPI000F5A7D2B|nr:hypothetical protein [Pedobacter sp. KBW01]RQO72567.1 hypothetical protein DBR40_14755 [Pedobacter sp. KBW01]